jgi:hypothetical protein
VTLLKFFPLSLYFIRSCFFLLIVLDFYLLSLLYNTQTTNFHAPGGIRIRNPSKRATTTLALDRSTARIGRFDPRAKQPQVKRMTALVIVFVVYVLFSASSDTCFSLSLCHAAQCSHRYAFTSQASCPIVCTTDFSFNVCR